MDSSRRGFLRAAGLFMAASAMPGLAFGAAKAKARGPRARFTEAPSPWPILQGPTNHEATTFVVLHPQRRNFSYTVSGENGEAPIAHLVDRWDLPSSSFAVSEIAATGLRPGVSYTLRLEDTNGSLIDERSFAALDVTRDRCRFAVVSCMSDSYTEQATTMWEALENEACDFVFLIGDTCYADADNAYGDEGGYSRRYAEARSRLGWFKLARLTPTFATWDDHDYGHNNADRTLPAKKFTHELFPRFFGTSENLNWRRGHGVGSYFEACGQRFFLFDDRSFRDPSGSPGGRHWGEAQTEWLFEELNRSDAPAWLMNGSQFFGGYLGKESYEGDHPEDFSMTLARLKEVRAPVAFVSGDVHFSELMAIEAELMGYPSYEFTSSAMHSFTAPFHQHRAYNKRRLVSEWRHNFLLFDVSVKNGWQMAVRCVREGNEVSFYRKLRIGRS